MSDHWDQILGVPRHRRNDMKTGETARQVAEREIAEEDFESTVVDLKKKIRRKVPFWHRVFPYTITIERRKYNDDE